ncbi:MAG: ABC transporter ATP-binding protein [Proteobacteria bacterium]|nr:ABC transporter ATP-binding protein [Pseudomonadota bacterium]
MTGSSRPRTNGENRTLVQRGGNELMHIVSDRVTVTFPQPDGGVFLAVDSFELQVQKGEFITIVGPSGCGKSTMLLVVDGLIRPSAGRLSIDGKPVTGPGTDRALVFQEFALLPWRNVERNVMLGLELQRKYSTSRMKEMAGKYIQMVGLQGFARHHPHQLSGGMRQRVGLARALAVNPEILLMDEPFAALDAQTREIMSEELLRIWEKDKKTVLFVTHSIEESVYLADKVVVMKGQPGKVKEIIPVDLPRPRDLSIKDDPHFVKLRRHIWNLLVEEVHWQVDGGEGSRS